MTEFGLNKIFEYASQLTKKRIGVTGKGGKEALEAIVRARDRGWIEPLTCGQVFEDYGGEVCLPNAEVMEARQEALSLLEKGAINGVLDTGPYDRDFFSFLDQVFAKTNSNSVASYISIFQTPGEGRLTLFTDTLVNRSPGLKEKAAIIQNAAVVAKSIGISSPKVAALAPIEIVNPSIQSTIDAAALSKMSERGQLGSITVEGPLAMDNAESAEAARHKGIRSTVPGDVDIYLFPDLDSANLCIQFVRYLGPFEVAGVMGGTEFPLIIRPAIDSPGSWFLNITLGLLTHEAG